MSDLGLVADPPTGVGTRTIPFEMNLGSTHTAAVSASSLVNQPGRLPGRPLAVVRAGF